MPLDDPYAGHAMNTMTIGKKLSAGFAVLGLMMAL
jgi:hypothetical protein